MSSYSIKSTEAVVQCSDNGKHPLTYINLSNGSARCHYCGQKFIKTTAEIRQKVAA